MNPNASEWACTEANVWAIVNRTGMDFGTVLNVLTALDYERLSNDPMNK